MERSDETSLIKEMSNSRSAFIRKNHVGIFVGLTFIISYLFGIPFNMFISPLVQNTNEVVAVLLPRFVTVYGPAIAAVAITLYIAEPYSTKSLFNKLIPRTRYLGWCIVLPLSSLFIAFCAFANAGVPILQLAYFLAKDWNWLILQFIVQLIIVGIGEELGWRGWLLPTLAQRQSLLKCALWIFIVWGLWHFPIFFSGAAMVGAWLMILCALTILTTWLWHKVDGNIFVLAILHASFNASVSFLENRLRDTNTPGDVIQRGWIVLGCIYLLIAIVVFIGDRKIWTTRLVSGSSWNNNESILIGRHKK